MNMEVRSLVDMVLVALAVLGALVWLVRRRKSGGKSGCACGGGAGACGKAPILPAGAVRKK